MFLEAVCDDSASLSHVGQCAVLTRDVVDHRYPALSSGAVGSFTRVKMFLRVLCGRKHVLMFRGPRILLMGSEIRCI